MLEQEYNLFKELNRRLEQEDLDLTITCVGGFVMSHYGMRTTHDIDGFYKATKKIESIIKDVGDKYKVNTEDELWLNNSVQNMNDIPPGEICSVLYEFSNLKVLTPSLDYIACMKLRSAREQDILDVASIIRYLEIKAPEVIEKKLKEYGFGSVDESLILESFGQAYGMDWLEKYYIENEKKINKKIKNISF